MTTTALSVFAQVIPVLFIAAFLGGAKIGRDRVSRIVAIGYLAIGVLAEAICLLYLAVDITPGVLASAAIYIMTLYMLIAIIATGWVHLQDHDESTR